MSKIKEIRKIESPIKEIKKEKSLDDEVEEDSVTETFEDNVGIVRRFNRTSTLDSNETPQVSTPVRERNISKEDEQEIRFRPSYTGTGNESKSAYTPVGGAEMGAVGSRKNIGEERVLERRSELQQARQEPEQRGEMTGARAYVEDNDKKRDRRREM